MTHPSCDTTMLETLRQKALVGAAGARDPLLRQQYLDLASAYAETATELRERGAAILPSPSPTRMPWRSIPMWISNDR